MFEGKQRLLELEKTGQYLFHGSADEIEVFEPRQAYNWVNGVKEKDGEPAVFASPSIDYAISMALLTSQLDVVASAENKEAEEYTLRISVAKDTFNLLKPDRKGFVYVFNKNNFPDKNGPAEFVSHKSLKPLEKVIVTKEDLPENLEIL